MLAEVYIYVGVLLAGLASFLSPCVLPLVPPYLGYLGGTTVSQATAEEGLAPEVWRRMVLGSVCFVLGFTTVFVALGAGASALGQLIRSTRASCRSRRVIVIVAFGLHFLGVVRIPLLYSEARYHGRSAGCNRWRAPI